jgi:hypothetical protein
MAQNEFNQYGDGDINVYLPAEPAKKNNYSGDVIIFFGYGCAAILAAQMVAAAAAFLAANAVAIGGVVTVGAAGTVAVAYRKRLAAMLPARPATALPEPVQTVAALPAPEPVPAIQISPAAQQRIAFLRNSGYTLESEDEAAVERLVRVEEQKRREEAWA